MTGSAELAGQWNTVINCCSHRDSSLWGASRRRPTVFIVAAVRYHWSNQGELASQCRTPSLLSIAAPAKQSAPTGSITSFEAISSVCNDSSKCTNARTGNAAKNTSADPITRRSPLMHRRHIAAPPRPPCGPQSQQKRAPQRYASYTCTCKLLIGLVLPGKGSRLTGSIKLRVCLQNFQRGALIGCATRLFLNRAVIKPHPCVLHTLDGARKAN
jgi:hypothetical protein